jgi:hypothetical protein
MAFLIRSTLLILGCIGLGVMVLYGTQPDKMPPESALPVVAFNQRQGQRIHAYLWVFDHQNTHRKLLTRYPDNAIFQLLPIAFPNQLAFIQADSPESVFVKRQGVPSGQLSHTPYRVFSVLRPNSGELVYLSATRQLIAENQTLLVSDYQISRYAFAPDGQQLIFYGRPESLPRWSLFVTDLNTVSASPQAIGNYSPNRYLGWLTSGWIFSVTYNGRDNNMSLIRIRPDGTDFSQIYFFLNHIPASIVASPNGKWLAFDDDYHRTLVLLNIETGQTRILVDFAQTAERSGNGFIYAEPLGWSPDGQWIYYARNEDSQIALYRIAPTAPSNSDGQRLASIRLGRYDMTWLVFHRHPWPRRWWMVIYGGCFLLGWAFEQIIIQIKRGFYAIPHP